MRLWHQTLGMDRSQILKEKIDAWFMKRKFVPAFEMTEESVQSLFQLIDDFQPYLIDGYAESLNFLSIGSRLNLNWSPLAVMSSAQELTQATRIRVEALFGTKIYDKYGSREFSGIAYQCAESDSHHVQDESYIVEILAEGRSARPGEIGEVVITDLNNFSTPMIRYRIGDLAMAVQQGGCPCGRNHSKIGSISGRTQALIACANGVWLPGTFFAHFFKDFEFAVRHFQIFQEEIGHFEVRVVPTPLLTKGMELKIIKELQVFTGNETIIRLIRVESIPLLRTGKRTPVISRVKTDFQRLDSSNSERN